jgi:hypothetical protein
MNYFAGLDISVKDTSVCILDDAGRIVKEVKVASEPQALLKILGNPNYRFKRIGLEAGPLSQWLFSALAEAELPVICVETRHMQELFPMPITATRSERIGCCTRMRRFIVRFNGPESFVHTRSSAGFTTITSGFEFSVHTQLSLPFVGCRFPSSQRLPPHLPSASSRQ